MAEIISLVKGDTVADLQVTLVRDDTGTAFNATGIALTMQIKKKSCYALQSVSRCLGFLFVGWVFKYNSRLRMDGDW